MVSGRDEELVGRDGIEAVIEEVVYAPGAVGHEEDMGIA